MPYSLYKLHFATGLHIGTEHGGPSLDDGRMTIHSDTIFSSLCCEYAQNGGQPEEIFQWFEDERIVISDALPFCRDEYYLPKPMIYFKNLKQEGNPENRKAFKSIEYIPLSAFDEYLGHISGQAEIVPEELKCFFGALTSGTRASIREEPQPYQVAYWNFAKDAGLYVIAECKDSGSLALFEQLLSFVGLSGMGGKQSSGLGKFNVIKEDVPAPLQEMLADTDANYQMLLGTALPSDHELDEILSDGWYMAARRGGFVRSETYSQMQRKKRTLYMLLPGSCFKRRFSGEIFDVSSGGAHPVWRCGKTLFAGLRV
jgi:CRISPR-associated protein Csm4